MKHPSILFALIIGLFALSSCATMKGRMPLPGLEPGLRTELRLWLDEHGSSPEEYLASKFLDHDIVFLGEYHRIKQDPLLVQSVIPSLYRAGVYNLGLEFLVASDQAELDRLLAGESYDEELAKRLFWNWETYWGYWEYVDILRAAWLLNSKLPAGEKRFRVLALNGRSDWSYMWSENDRENPEVMRKVWPDGDEVMARTIRDDILAKGEKALVYSGINHAYTRFRQPFLNSEGELVGLNSFRMGNRIAAEIGDRACTIFLHSPWPPASGYDDPYTYPADGAIDALFAAEPSLKRPVGFDVAGSPFGRLPMKTSAWGLGGRDLRLEDYCDGWIFQKPLSEYEGVTAIPGWYNEANREEAIAQIANPDPRVKNKLRSVRSLSEGMARDADIKRRFASFR